MSAQDWREAADGIPPWPGCLMFHPFTGIYRRMVRVTASSWAMEGGYDPSTISEYRPDAARSGGWIVALDDPDTRAAYDRRLALALGAPVEAVNIGVRFILRHDGAGYVTAGFCCEGHDGTGPEWTGDLLGLGTTDPLLARALAWPADKRVRG